VEIGASLCLFLPAQKAYGPVSPPDPSNAPRKLTTGTKRKPGRPPLDPARKLAAYEARMAGHPWAYCARKLYSTSTPTLENIKNSERIVRKYATKQGLPDLGRAKPTSR
jgi:hypothetical protein